MQSNDQSIDQEQIMQPHIKRASVPQPRDTICVTGIREYGYTGALPEEQVLGQWFEVDVTLWRDLAQAAESDRLQDTHDYRTTIQIVKNIIRTQTFALIEALAGAIADAILEHDDIKQVQVRLTKVAAPIPGFSGQITIDITR